MLQNTPLRRVYRSGGPGQWTEQVRSDDGTDIDLSFLTPRTVELREHALLWGTKDRECKGTVAHGGWHRAPGDMNVTELMTRVLPY